MYKPETLKKYVELMKKCINFFLCILAAGVDLSISISLGNKKIGRVMNVSLPPIISCGNCSHCAPFCYDIKANLFHTNSTLLARAKNYALFLFSRDIYFSQVEKAISKRRVNKFFRWHVGGEIVDYDYFCRMVEIARKYSDFRFWTYTKMHEIVNLYCLRNGGRAAIPENFNIMFSVWDGMPYSNPYSFKIFACKLKDGNKDLTEEDFSRMFKCPGNCDICKAAKSGCIYGTVDIYADQH